MPYKSINPQRVVDTATSLQRRIGDRFPDSSLRAVAGEVCGVAEGAAALCDWLARPNLPLRLLAGLGILGVVAVVGSAFASVRVKFEVSSLAELLQALEAGINEILFLAAAVFFLVSLETRLKRRRALKALHELRSLAHVIDMHQLTKDPDSTANPERRIASSPERIYTPALLTRYLDYCSELLAIISKVGALYVQRFNDPVTLTAVNDIEDLTAGLSRKIWQKLVILDRIVAGPEGRA